MSNKYTYTIIVTYNEGNIEVIASSSSEEQLKQIKDQFLKYLSDRPFEFNYIQVGSINNKKGIKIIPFKAMKTLQIRPYREGDENLNL